MAAVYPDVLYWNRARRQSGFPTFIPCQRQNANVLPKRRQSHQGDKLCDVSTVPLVARGPVFSARGSDADGEPHYSCSLELLFAFFLATTHSYKHRSVVSVNETSRLLQLLIIPGISFNRIILRKLSDQGFLHIGPLVCPTLCHYNSPHQRQRKYVLDGTENDTP